MKERAIRTAIATAAFALSVVSVARYVRDRADRRSAEEFLKRFDVAARRPADAATVPLAPSADLAANVVADIALSDAHGTHRLDGVSPELRARWLRAMEAIDDELLAARAVTLDAIARRPGWAAHWSMLGMLVYTWQRRQPMLPSAIDVPQWFEPLRLGLQLSPGDGPSATALATAVLEQWPSMPAGIRGQTSPIFSRALIDDQFASAAFPIVIQAIGRHEALALLPGEPRTLHAASASLAEQGDVAGAIAIYRKWEIAEWRSRAIDLERLEERARLHDVESLRNMSIDWMTTHSATDFDTPVSYDQLVRVLQLTINDRKGSWRTDPRASVLRFLLNHRMTAGRPARTGIETVPGGTAVGNAMSALADVPDPIRARARLLAGDLFGAESLLHRSDSAGSFEWTPFLVDLARFRLTLNMPDAARRALDSLAPAAQNECEALLAGMEIDRTSGTEATDGPARTLRVAELPDESWHDAEVISLCIDPEGSSRSYLVTTIEADALSLVSYGWNEGRRASVVVPAGRFRLTVPLAGRWGRNLFFVRTIIGGPARPVTSTIERR